MLNVMIRFEVMLNIVLIALVSGLSVYITIQGQRLNRYEVMLGKKRQVRRWTKSQTVPRSSSEKSERLAA